MWAPCIATKMLGTSSGKDRYAAPVDLQQSRRSTVSFADKVVFVTGAGQGRGRAVVQHFGAAGAQVVAVDINLEAASAAVSSGLLPL